MKRVTRQSKAASSAVSDKVSLASPSEGSSSSSSQPTQTASQEKKIPKTSEQMLADQADKWEKWRVRTISTLFMLFGFALVIYLGHVAVALLVVVLQGVIFGEIVGLRYKRMEEYGIPNFRFLSWYFYFATVYFGYGQALKDVEGVHIPLMKYHTFSAFVIYVIGILFFILNLRKGLYRRQFGQFAWTHMTLLLVVAQSTLMISNIFGGLIWFLLPCFCVIANDIMAFIVGFFFGRTPLIQLSPKKTWEGFIGGLIMTVLLAFLFAGFMSQYEMFVCPLVELSWRPTVHCVPSMVFRPQLWRVPEVLANATGIATVTARPVQVHALVFSLFASLVAPFGGFFASGFKRAFRIKDFGDSIPGHGGLTDRMDCQILMALFVYVYYTTFVSVAQVATVPAILQAAMELSEAQRKELITALLNIK